MGVKFARKYSDIIRDLSNALETIQGLNDFFHMDIKDWEGLTQEERHDCIRTLSDDVIYALGQHPFIEVGLGSVEYDETRHLLMIRDGSKTTRVNLL